MVKRKNDWHKIKVYLKKDRPMNYFRFMIFIALTFIVGGMIFYHEGKNDVYKKQQLDLENQEKLDIQTGLMQENVSEVKDTFWKFVMIEIMTNWKLFIILLACAIFFRAII